MQVAIAHVSIVPVAKGFRDQLIEQTQRPASEAGDAAGDTFGSTFSAAVKEPVKRTNTKFRTGPRPPGAGRTRLGRIGELRVSTGAAFSGVRCRATLV
jgi:hypothetical protein